MVNWSINLPTKWLKSWFSPSLIALGRSGLAKNVGSYDSDHMWNSLSVLCRSWLSFSLNFPDIYSTPSRVSLPIIHLFMGFGSCFISERYLLELRVHSINMGLSSLAVLKTTIFIFMGMLFWHLSSVVLNLLSLCQACNLLLYLCVWFEPESKRYEFFWLSLISLHVYFILLWIPLDVDVWVWKYCIGWRIYDIYSPPRTGVTLVRSFLNLYANPWTLLLNHNYMIGPSVTLCGIRSRSWKSASALQYLVDI